MVLSGVILEPSLSVILSRTKDELSPAVTISLSNVGCLSAGSDLTTFELVVNAALPLCMTLTFLVSKLLLVISFVTIKYCAKSYVPAVKLAAVLSAPVIP